MLIKNNIRKLLLLFGLLFIGYLISNSWGKLVDVLPAVKWIYFSLSIIIALLGNLLLGSLYAILLNKYGIDFNRGLAYRIFFYSQIAKYIPGKIWSIWYQAANLTSSHAVASVLFANIDLALSSVILVSGISIAIVLAKISLAMAVIATAVLFYAFLFVVTKCLPFNLSSRLSIYLINKKNRWCVCREISPSSYVCYVFVLYTVLYVASYVLMLISVFGISIYSAVTYTAYLGLAWVVGVLAVISPSGLGVRELFFVFITQTMVLDVSLDQIAAIAVVSRAWSVVLELSGAIIVHFWFRLQRLYLLVRSS